MKRFAEILGAMLLGMVATYVLQLVVNREDLLVLALGGAALIWGPRKRSDLSNHHSPE